MVGYRDNRNDTAHDYGEFRRSHPQAANRRSPTTPRRSPRCPNGVAPDSPLDVLTPRRHVGAPPQEDDGEPFENKMKRLVAELREQQAEGRRLDAAIAANLTRLGFGD